MKSKPMRLVLGLVVVGVVVVLAMPVVNLFAGPPRSALASIDSPDPTVEKAAEVLAAKCAGCHTGDAELPFYSALPVAKGLIQQDIERGVHSVDYAKELTDKEGKPAEVVLAKTEHVIEEGTMPPAHYRLMHWNGGLDAAEADALVGWVRAERGAHYATGTAAEAFKDEPVQPVPASAGGDAAKVALGNKLYHDKRLSKDNTLACASCHDLAKGGTDQAQYSTGVGGEVGGINSPTVFNSGLQFVQFWDGRAADLVAQADGPVNNPIEMASNWEEAIGKLQQDAALVQEIQTVYPQGGLCKESVLDAIATFEQSLLTPNSKFDRYLAGDASALSAEEQKGYGLFKEHGCASCHVGKAMGGQSYERMGRHGDYFADRGKPTDADNGRFNVTKDEKDRHAFKTPVLRNVALTFPYLHDGSQTDLKEVVKIMGKYQVGVAMSEGDAELITAFLGTLTGEYNGQVL